MTNQFLDELEQRLKNIQGYYSNTEWYDFAHTETNKDLVLDLIKEVKKERARSNKLLISLEYYLNESIFNGKIKRIDGASHTTEADKAIKEWSK